MLNHTPMATDTDAVPNAVEGIPRENPKPLPEQRQKRFGIVSMGGALNSYLFDSEEEQRKECRRLETRGIAYLTFEHKRGRFFVQGGWTPAEAEL